MSAVPGTVHAWAALACSVGDQQLLRLRLSPPFGPSLARPRLRRCRSANRRGWSTRGHRQLKLETRLLTGSWKSNSLPGTRQDSKSDQSQAQPVTGPGVAAALQTAEMN